MGQYYRPIILDNRKKTIIKFAKSWEFNNGSKLMEHSWILNPFVGSFERLLIKNPLPVVWSGDYSDEIPFNKIPKRIVKLLIKDGHSLSDLKKRGINLYSLCDVIGDKLIPTDKPKALPKRFKYLVNHDKKIFVDKTKIPSIDGWTIHPLPLLTCEGNGQGGGDYFGEDENNLIGSWARDIISVESRKTDIPKTYDEIIFNLTE